MITLEERSKEALDLFRNNVDALADMADGDFIDLKVRPKSDRKKFTFKQYKKDVLEGCDRLENAPEAMRNQIWNHLSGLKDFILAALDNQFTRYRDIYNLVTTPLDNWEPPEDLEERKKSLQKIRAEQDGWAWHDRRSRCPQCYPPLPIYIRDINNNYIDLKERGKRKVCMEHSASGKLRGRMKKEREDRRREQEGKKKKAKPKKDPERYK